MSTEIEVPVESVGAAAPQGMRKNGKQWHVPKTAFRPKAGNGTYEKRQAERVAMAAVKAKEKEMKDEKEAARQVRSDLPSLRSPSRVIEWRGDWEEIGADSCALQVKIQAIKDKRAKKEEKARFEKLAETMHRKRVERLKRKEKRNKMLKS
ncbi:hypothetical protein ONS96_003295 [Cadophora gregata f. sp. sojae]|nr:hypothetical protein ONS96_003295 [Cadophora gregata f. sp. sojae]